MTDVTWIQKVWTERFLFHVTVRYILQYKTTNVLSVYIASSSMCLLELSEY